MYISIIYLFKQLTWPPISLNTAYKPPVKTVSLLWSSYFGLQQNILPFIFLWRFCSRHLATPFGWSRLYCFIGVGFAYRMLLNCIVGSALKANGQTYSSNLLSERKGGSYHELLKKWIFHHSKHGSLLKKVFFSLSRCVKQEMESDPLLKPASSNTLGQTLDTTA